MNRAFVCPTRCSERHNQGKADDGGSRVSPTSISGRRVLVVLVLCIGVTCLAIGATLLFELSVISRAISDFRLDEAVGNARISRGEKAAVEDVLNPPYLKQYGLDLNL